MSSGDRPWPAATQALLVGVGVVLGVVTFLGVLTMPDLQFHPARHLELQASYDAYRETGVLLVKEAGSGSWYASFTGSGLIRAAGDDDPGTYLVASLMSNVTGSASPYSGLRLVMALLCALPLLVLPVTVARIFRRARAGLAMLALPVVTWLVNNGTVLVGTEYGLADLAAPRRVYALYGMTASLAFLSLVLIAHLTTHRLRLATLVPASLLVILLASAGNLLRSLSGVGIALALAVLWWMFWPRRGRLLVAAAASVVGVVGSLAIPQLVMGAVERDRAQVISAEAAALPDTHGTWHPLYLGLSYPEPITGEASPFGIEWSDQFGWRKAGEIDPNVVPASREYDAIIKDLYLDTVKAHPGTAARLYLDKILYTVKSFGAMLVLIAFGFGLALRRPGPHRRSVGLVVAVCVPLLAFGLVPPVLVMPMLYYYSELVAALGLLSAVALGGLVWAFSTLPSYIRVDERRHRSAWLPARQPAARPGLSLVVPSRNGARVLPGTLDALGRELGADDEIVVVENGSTDDTTAVVESIADSWPYCCSFVVLHSRPGVGNALRTGVLASTRNRLLLSADDLPFGFSDLESFRLLPQGVTVAIGSKGHPDSQVDRSWRRTTQSLVFRWLREALLHSTVADSQGTIWVDGDWARSFATISRETGLMWSVELVLAAEQQGLDVYEVPVSLVLAHDEVSSRFSLSDALVGVREIWRLAMRKDDYATAPFTPGRAMASTTAGV